MGKKPLRWIMILQAVFPVFAYRYELWYGVNAQRPVDVITDVVNDLGVKILQQYSNHGNVAFSPMGVAFVLLALYEGSAGRGSQQIINAVGLPANRDITRIGFRDIHRRLRTYLNADGFLGGLTLSRENTKLRSEYEDILRFYGFDLSSVQQETNITVSVKNASSTTELPKSTISTTPLPVGMSTVNISGMTTLTTNTTVSPNLITTETTISESIAPGVVTQVPVTVGTDVQPTSVSATNTTVSFAGNIPTQTTNLLTTINSSTISGESTQLSVGAESVATSPNIIMTTTELTPISMGNQTTVTMTVSIGDQSTQISTSIGTGDTETIANTIVPGSSTVTESDVINTNANGLNANTSQAPLDTINTSTVTSIATDDTNVAASMDMLAVANTVNMMSINTTSVNSMIPAISGIANVTVPSSVIETMMDNSIISELNTGTLTSANTPGNSITAETIGSATASIIDVDNNDATVSTSAETVDVSSSDSMITNSTMITILMGNRTAASLVDENTISMNRKKKAINIASRLDMPRNSMASKNTVNIDKSTARRTLNFHKRSARSPRGYFSSYPDEGIWMQNLDIWKSYSMVNPDEVPAEDSASEISFLVNGCDVSSVSATRYIAVLPFAYFPSLNAVAIEFPLDDPRYNIILLMPTDRTDTRRLVRDLDGKSLRSLRKRLQPTWVRATIPSFMLRGFVTLTSLLQRLGILDIFEPRVADLSLMTSDLGVYARDVQQSIGVNIRNYLKPDRTHSRESSNVASPSTVPSRRDSYRYLPPGNGLFERAGPVPFTALHPFLYFIVDTETSVSLIAGRIDDPLNSRIL